MKDDPLESLLTGLPLRQPGDAMDARVDAVFADFQSHRRLRLYPFALAACLLIAIGIGVRLMQPKSRPVTAVVSRPIQIERDTTRTYDDGIIASTDDAAYQQFRRRTVRETWYIDPATHAQVVLRVPAEQILIRKVDAF